MKHASLFSGIGGFDLAADWMGWQNLFHCEINPFCRRILKHYWQHAHSYEDIFDTDFTFWSGRIDVLTGGFPCQPFSHAGKRKGTDDHRFLWSEMLRAVREIQPQWVVAENVPGLLTIERGMVFERILVDLEMEGYEVSALVIPACAVSAPHQRDRVWIIAHANSGQRERTLGRSMGETSVLQSKHRAENSSAGRIGGTDSTTSDHRESGWREDVKAICGGQPFIARNPIPHPHPHALRHGGRQDDQRQKPSIGDRIAANAGDSPHPDNERQPQQVGLVGEVGRRVGNGIEHDWGKHWLEAATRLCVVDDGLPGRLDFNSLPGARGWRPKNEKQAFGRWRSESLKGYGNSIVPQVAFQIFKAISVTK